MITPEYALYLARYNRWMNQKIYAASEQLSDAERKADRGAFFKSIHSTLNHLVWGDGMWLGRFTKDTPLQRAMPGTPAGADVHADWNELKAARDALDADLLIWVAQLDADWLAQDFSWYSGMSKSWRSGPGWQSVVHMFNHQTHHRGQVSTLLSQQGIDLGVTDLMAMPATA